MLNLGNEKIREAKREDPMIGYFLSLKRGGSKPNLDEIADQADELKSLWALWESIEVGAGGLLFRKWTGLGSRGCRWSSPGR